MKTFEQFISEGRDAPLYHGTNPRSLVTIIKQGIIPHTYHYPNNASLPDQMRGVSVSRDYKFSADYRADCLLELDQTKLAQNFKIVPYQYWDRPEGSRRTAIPGHQVVNRLEYEEFIITDKPISFNKYVTHIYLTNRALSRVATNAAELSDTNYTKSVMKILSKLTNVPITIVDKMLPNNVIMKE